MLHQCFKYCQNGQMRKIVVDTALFTIVEAHFIDTKFYFKSTMMEELRSPHDYPGEEKVNSKSSKEHNSSANEGMTHPTKNKGKEKVVENFFYDKISCKTMVLCYIQVPARKNRSIFFSKDEEKINKGLKNLTLPTTNLVLNKVS